MTTDAPMIGQFSGPQDNAPRLPTLKKKEVPVTAAPAQESEKSPDPEKKPEDIYAEFHSGLEKASIDIVKAREIMDQVLEKTYYTETHNLRKTEIVIRSRNYRDTLRTQRFLEAESPSYAVNVDEIIMRYNTAASLVRFGQRAFDHPEDDDKSSDTQIEEAFDQRLRFVQTLPSVVVGKLGTLVYNMDLKLQAVFAEGAPEDF
jgi:hypothetical protein